MNEMSTQMIAKAATPAHGDCPGRAFVDAADRLYYALPAYVSSTLPTRDRRDPRLIERRGDFRGGRRAADVAIAV